MCTENGFRNHTPRHYESPSIHDQCPTIYHVRGGLTRRVILILVIVRLGEQTIGPTERREQMEEALRIYGEYDFETQDGRFGAPYGVALLKQIFPTVQRAKGMSVWATPIGKVVVTCRRIVRI
jgi:hypothetical protein